MKERGKLIFNFDDHSKIALVVVSKNLSTPSKLLQNLHTTPFKEAFIIIGPMKSSMAGTGKPVHMLGEYSPATPPAPSILQKSEYELLPELVSFLHWYTTCSLCLLQSDIIDPKIHLQVGKEAPWRYSDTGTAGRKPWKIKWDNCSQGRIESHPFQKCFRETGSRGGSSAWCSSTECIVNDDFTASSVYQLPTHNGFPVPVCMHVLTILWFVQALCQSPTGRAFRFSYDVGL